MMYTYITTVITPTLISTIGDHERPHSSARASPSPVPEGLHAPE